MATTLNEVTDGPLAPHTSFYVQKCHRRDTYKRPELEAGLLRDEILEMREAKQVAERSLDIPV